MDVLRIEWADLDLRHAKLSVGVSKTGERMVIPLSTSMVALLATLPRTGLRLFPWRTGTGVYRWLKPLCEAVGVSYTPHQSRHALATAALAAGIPDREAADLGAWRDARSLHRYQHVESSGVAGRSVGILLGESTGEDAAKPLKKPA